MAEGAKGRSGSSGKPHAHANRAYAKGLARAFAGAIIFSFPLLMTMEMWWLGFYMDRLRLFLFTALGLLVVLGLSRVAGFRESSGWQEDLVDALAAYAVAIIASATVLGLFGLITPEMPPEEVIGKTAIQAVPASFGAMVARKQLGGSDREQKKGKTSYLGELFLMLAGALFLAFNVAPTEEMILISFRMSPWQAFALMLASIALLHALMYTVGFSGEEHDGGSLETFFRFSIVGFGIAIAISLYVLWTFGRTEGIHLPQIAMMTAVLTFPAAIGAGTARLVV